LNGTEEHLRSLADLTADRCADILAFPRVVASTI
jgi:hypothetical protein